MTGGMYLIFGTGGGGPRLPDLRLLAEPGSPEFQILHLADFYLWTRAAQQPVTVDGFLAYAAEHPGTLPTHRIQLGDGLPLVEYVYRLTLADPHHQLLLEVTGTAPGVGRWIPTPIIGATLLPAAAAMCERLAVRAARAGTDDGFTVPGGDADRWRARASTYRELHRQTANQRTSIDGDAGIAGVGVGDGPLIEFDPVACRAWLLDGAAAEAGIDDGFRSENLTVAAGVEALLALLNHDATQRVWRPACHVHQVLIWRTGDGGGIDGGGLLTIDLDYPGARVRLGCRHQGFDAFIRDSATCGIDAAVEALGHVAAVVNRTYATFRTAAATPSVTARRQAPVDGEDEATVTPG